MTVLVTGAMGQLGSCVCRHFDKHNIAYVGVAIDQCDLTDEAQVKVAIMHEQPNIVIHCAAYTAVDKAECERDYCFAVNAHGTANVAAACAEIGAAMIYISTDYVFDGSGDVPWETDAATDPVNAYGESKLRGEEEVVARLEKYFIVRTSWVFGEKGSNFVKSILNLGRMRDEICIVNDQIGSPTYAEDLAELLMQMIMTEKYGVYHATNEGFCSRYEFARKIAEIASIPCTIKPIPTVEYSTAARRPLNSRLSKKSLDRASFRRLPHWEDALSRYMRALLKYE